VDGTAARRGERRRRRLEGGRLMMAFDLGVRWVRRDGRGDARQRRLRCGQQLLLN
jgi:hypothetical protein